MSWKVPRDFRECERPPSRREPGGKVTWGTGPPWVTWRLAGDFGSSDSRKRTHVSPSVRGASNKLGQNEVRKGLLSYLHYTKGEGEIGTLSVTILNDSFEE